MTITPQGERWIQRFFACVLILPTRKLPLALISCFTAVSLQIHLYYISFCLILHTFTQFPSLFFDLHIHITIPLFPLFPWKSALICQPTQSPDLVTKPTSEKTLVLFSLLSGVTVRKRKISLKNTDSATTHCCLEGSLSLGWWLYI